MGCSGIDYKAGQKMDFFKSSLNFCLLEEMYFHEVSTCNFICVENVCLQNHFAHTGFCFYRKPQLNMVYGLCVAGCVTRPPGGAKERHFQSEVFLLHLVCQQKTVIFCCFALEKL